MPDEVVSAILRIARATPLTGDVGIVQRFEDDSGFTVSENMDAVLRQAVIGDCSACKKQVTLHNGEDNGGHIHCFTCKKLHTCRACRAIRWTRPCQDCDKCFKGTCQECGDEEEHRDLSLIHI